MSKTKAPQLNELLNAFHLHRCEPPAGYIWAVEHRLFGFEEFTQFEPWHFCRLEEIRPLTERWPGFKTEHDLLPFARRQDQDELACFKVESGRVVGIWLVHYSLGPPPSWEVSQKHETFWDWARGIIKDVELWSEL